MMLVDANLLLYAYHPRSKVHEASRAWLESAFSGRELVRIAWMTVFAFLRISTNPHVFERPLSTDEASAIVSRNTPTACFQRRRAATIVCRRPPAASTTWLFSAPR